MTYTVTLIRTTSKQIRDGSLFWFECKMLPHRLGHLNTWSLLIVMFGGRLWGLWNCDLANRGESPVTGLEDDSNFWL